MLKIIYILLITLNLQAQDYTNSLINQDSPYLKQHAHNPVNWMAWNDKTFEKAKKENKLIFLSIGYSTCHWCHVMEDETFTNLSSAKILNKNYISIKVDREEMPDVDKYYQNVFRILNNRAGGWPLSIVMTPSRKVIYANTYIPARPIGRIIDFNTLLTYINQEFKKSPKKINKSANKVASIIEKNSLNKNQQTSINLDILDTFVEDINFGYDEHYKGIAHAPKFPHANTFDTLVDIYRTNHNTDSLRMSQESLKAMAKGGIYDQIEGGFFRYSTDNMWMIPHFEKMLYTNAELIGLYSKMYSIVPNKLFKKVVQESIKNIDDKFLYEGLYKSASDADSEAEEGKYFVFSFSKAKKALKNAGVKNREEILKYFNITKDGNFENHTTNPYIKKQKIPKNITRAKKILKKLRAKTTYPFIDSKLSTSWNSLLACGFFEAKSVNKKYAKKAVVLVDNILNKLEKNGTLYHQLLPNSTLKVKGLLEDYSFLISALIKANQYTQNKKYLTKATKLTHLAIKKFYKNKTWYLSDKKFTSQASLNGSSYKSAMANMIKNIFILALLNEDEKLHNFALKNLNNISYRVKNYPSSFPEAVQIVIMAKKALILLKGKSDRVDELKKIKDNINYPFLYIQKSDENILEACSQKECFAYSKDSKELERDIKNYLK
jgi:uncharacterized protein YyaL (SSP411 family)